jgi:hypothetical protein
MSATARSSPSNKGADIADAHIVDASAPGDFCVTADIPQRKPSATGDAFAARFDHLITRAPRDLDR